MICCPMPFKESPRQETAGETTVQPRPSRNGQLPLRQSYHVSHPTLQTFNGHPSCAARRAPGMSAMTPTPRCRLLPKRAGTYLSLTRRHCSQDHSRYLVPQRQQVGRQVKLGYRWSLMPRHTSHHQAEGFTLARPTSRMSWSRQTSRDRAHYHLLRYPHQRMRPPR